MEVFKSFASHKLQSYIISCLILILANPCQSLAEDRDKPTTNHTSEAIENRSRRLDLFKHLCQLPRDTQRAEPFPADYAKVENKLADDLCTMVTAKKSSEIIQRLGEPYSISPSAKDNKQSNVWTYYFGLSPKIIRLEILDGLCSRARFIDFEEDQNYKQWRIKSLLEQPLTQSKAVIYQEQGPPAHIRFLTDLSNSIWTYRLGNQTVELMFNHDECISSDLSKARLMGGMTPPDWNCKNNGDLKDLDDSGLFFTLPSKSKLEPPRSSDYGHRESMDYWLEGYHLYFKIPAQLTR